MATELHFVEQRMLAQLAKKGYDIEGAKFNWAVEGSITGKDGKILAPVVKVAPALLGLQDAK